MALSIDCGEGSHHGCRGTGLTKTYLIPQLDGEVFDCACWCHRFDFIEVPTEQHPMGSPCPYHQRVHRSHGWYVCILKEGLSNA